MTNRLFVCLLTLSLLLGCFGILAAQESPTTPNTASQYVVETGDNLWELAGAKMGNPVLWNKIYDRNPFLKKQGRRFTEGGVIYVLLKPGEVLEGLEELGITQSFVPLENLALPAAATAIPLPPDIEGVWRWWMWLLVGSVVVVGLLVRRTLNADTATSGLPVVPGGVDPVRATTQFQQTAARMSGRIAFDAMVPAVYQVFTVLRQTAGRIWGVLNVRYADGRETPRRLDGERAYEAVVRFPDGREETLHMLEACGNDLRYGGISRYLPGPDFRFEADPVHPAVAESQPPTPVAVELPTVQTITPEPEAEGLVIEFKPEEGGKDSMVRARGVDVASFSFRKTGREITFRFREVEEEELVAK